LRFLKLIVFTIVGLAFLFLGIALLIDGLASGRPLLTAAGSMALLALVSWCARAMLQSRQQRDAENAFIGQKLAAGKCFCRFCQIEFDYATCRKTPEAWYNTAIAIVIGLIPVTAAAIGLYALGFSSRESVMLLFVLAFGLLMLGFAFRGFNRVYYRCPQCGRSCGFGPKPRAG
jgi:hypothetical protein